MADLENGREFAVKFTGVPITSAERAIIMIHGRGASAEDILSVSKEIWLPDTCYLAPQAEDNTWYPNSFISPVEQNEPQLTEALSNLYNILKFVRDEGIPTEKIFWLGFSQGACLALEFTARNANRYGGIFALSGGLIGEEINKSNYKHNFKKTPVFLGCSDVDPHIPLKRVHESADVLVELGAAVRTEIYPKMTHTINQEEIDIVNEILMQKV